MPKFTAAWDSFADTVIIFSFVYLFYVNLYIDLTLIYFATVKQFVKWL